MTWKFDLTTLKSPVLIAVVVVVALLLALLIAYGDVVCTPSSARLGGLSWGGDWHGGTRWDCLQLGFLR
jgi:hypothetical protein